MCIRAPFNAAVAQALQDDDFFEPADRDAVDQLVAAAPEKTFRHPLALAGYLKKQDLKGFWLVDDETFSTAVKAIGPVLRGYLRLLKHHGDLFAGIPAALPPIGKAKPIIAKGYKRLARRTRRKPDPNRGMPAGLRLAKKYRRTPAEQRARGRQIKSEQQAAELRAMTEAFCAVAAAANSGTARDFGAPNVVDFVARRAQVR